MFLQLVKCIPLNNYIDDEWYLNDNRSAMVTDKARQLKQLCSGTVKGSHLAMMIPTGGGQKRQEKEKGVPDINVFVLQ